MSDTIEIIHITEINCASCGIRFGLPETLRQKRLDDHHSFYCPNGHSNYYPPPKKSRDEEMEARDATIQSLRDDLRAANDELARTRAWADQVEAGHRPLFRRRKRP